MKILTVDDDESILELVDHTLSISAHHDVTIAASGTQALEKIEMAESPFECFIVDIQMPGIDGIDLTRLIRQTAGYERHPVVMLTAMHEKQYLDKAFQAGATDYITKPFNFRDLRSRILEAQKLTHDKNWPPSENVAGQMVSWVRGELIHNSPVALFDRDQGQALLPYGEFENYVQEIARCYANGTARHGNRGPAVLGMKLADPSLTRSESSHEEIDSMLANLVLGANAVLRQTLSSISYRGNGTFICVQERHLNESSGTIERELNVHLHSCIKQQNCKSVQVFVGNQVPVRTASPSAVLDILWMASESVEQRFLSKRNLSTLESVY